MPNLATYHLAFRTGLHVGTADVRTEESDVTVSSGTLFAAVVDAARRTGIDPDTIVAPFPRMETVGTATAGTDPPPWLLTSAFPYAGEVRFFPAPVSLQSVFSPQTLRTRWKDLKSIRFVSEQLFREMLAGQQMDDQLFTEAGDAGTGGGFALQDGAFWMASDELRGLPQSVVPKGGRHALPRRHVYHRQVVPRVTVTRAGSAGELYHTGRVSFSEGCGLWFGVQWRDSAGSTDTAPAGMWRSVLEDALGVLQDDWLGGERSTGYGAFTWSVGTAMALPDVVPGEPMVLLSRYHPRSEEVSSALATAVSAYELVPVGGWLRTWDGAAQRRRRLWMVEAGSIAVATASPQGNLVDVRPLYDNLTGVVPHPVWRYGMALGTRWGGGA